jgi:hypothetical protein
MEFESTTQTISWFRDRYREGNLIIKPPYQRKPVWVARQKCYLIDSILSGLPVPEIYIQQIDTPDGDTTYAIVDGQQRIRTVLQFIGSETDPDEQEFNKFTLDKLDQGSPWKNKTFADLTNDIKSKFYGYRFTVRTLFTDRDADVRDMFQRLNRFLTPLKPQELRNSTYIGPFIELANKLADDEYWAENRIFTPAAIRRMGDIEFISELLIGVLHGPQGGSAADIDGYYERYEDFEDEFPDQKRVKKLYDDTLNIIRLVLPDIKESRWSNKTDFYTLFVSIADQLRLGEFAESKTQAFRKDLLAFADEVDARLASDRARVKKDAIAYVRAVEKGANDKKRRGDRHSVMVPLIEPFFKRKK